MVVKSHDRAARVLRAVMSMSLALLAVVAALTIALGVFARPGKDGISRLAGHPLLTVLSGSMVPVFHPGDMIVDDPVNASQASRLAPGDIITFHVAASPTELITHQIISVQRVPSALGGTSASGLGDVAYKTKGAANNAPDQELVYPSAIVGTYRGHIRYAGYFLQAVQRKTVFFFIILIPLLYLVISEIAKRWHQADPPRDSATDAVKSTQLVDEAIGLPASDPGSASTHEDSDDTLDDPLWRLAHTAERSALSKTGVRPQPGVHPALALVSPLESLRTSGASPESAAEKGGDGLS